MTPTSADVGMWILILVAMLPAAKVVSDWIRPSARRISPQPLEVTASPMYQTLRVCERVHDELNADLKRIDAKPASSVEALRHEIKSDIGSVHRRIDTLVETVSEMRGEIRAMAKRAGGN